MPLSKEEIEKFITKSCVGTDKITIKIFKSCTDAVSYPLEILIDKSFESVTFPKHLKDSHITYKKGIKQEISKYLFFQKYLKIHVQSR